MIMKTVLVPNAPWPQIIMEAKAKKAAPKKRVKPSEVDAKFNEWLQKECGYVKPIRRE
jgi:hypothetical protein